MTYTIDPAVESWFNLGLNVLPTKDKKPLVSSWKEWQTARQTKADIEKMPWEYANGFAVICGTESTQPFADGTKRVYLGVIDIDHKDTFDFSIFPETYIEKTPHGFHLFYWSKNPVEPKKYEGFELLGERNYVCIYGNAYNNLPINLQLNVKAQFEDASKKLNISGSKSSSPSNSKPTLKSLLSEDVHEGQRDNRAILLASKLRTNKRTEAETFTTMLEWNQKHCIPPLTDEIIKQKVESAFKPETPYYAEPKFNKVDFRDNVFQDLMSRLSFATLPSQEIYIYKDGVYSKQLVISIVKFEVEQAFGKYYTKYDFDQILDRIKAVTAKDIDYFTNKNLPLNLVCVQNGVVDLNTGVLKPHNPEFPFLNKLPMKFDAIAQCPIIDEKMHEWLESDAHVQAMYEFIGYCMLREYKYQHAIFLLGEGDNGKTTLLRLITAFLGEENVSHVPLQDLKDQFKMATLCGKLANFADELSNEALENTTALKELTGGSPIAAFIKYVQDPKNFTSIAKLLFATNELPRTTDKSHAFFRRPIIFNFLRAFTSTNGKKDPDLLKKLTTQEELSGLLNKAIEGLRRLLKNNAFSIQPSSADTEEMWTNDPIEEFVSETLESVGKSEFVTFREIYKPYIDYCQAKEIQPLEEDAFGVKLKRYIKFIRQRRTLEGIRQYVYYGIKIKGSLTKQGTL